MLLYEKYRQTELDDLVLEPKVRKFLDSCIDKKEIPHLLMTGQAGSGKTTIARILTNKIPCRVMELNGSSERGIDTIRDKVKNFAASYSREWKIILLEESDALTNDAFSSLRNLIETYQKDCRFIFTGNYENKFPDAIKSRCIHLKFEQFPKRSYLKHIKDILDKEQIEYDIEDVRDIVDKTYPDTRSTLNFLEYSSVGGKLSIKQNELFFSDFHLIAQHIEDGNLTELLKLFEKSSNFETVFRWLIKEWVPKQRPDRQRDLTYTIAGWSERIGDVIDPVVHMMGVCSEIMEICEIKGKFRK